MRINSLRCIELIVLFFPCSVAGHAAYVIGSLCDMEVGRRRILEIIVTYKDEGFDVLSNLTKILYCRDNESVMNASGTIGTLVNQS